MKRHPKLPVERLICLFPFMRYDLSAAQHLWHRALFLLSPLAVGTIGALRFVPSRLIQAVIHAATAGEYGSEALPTIAQMLHPAVAKNCFSLGEDEFNTVPKEFDYQAIAVSPKGGGGDTELNTIPPRSQLCPASGTWQARQDCLPLHTQRHLGD